VDDALRSILDQNRSISAETVQGLVLSGQKLTAVTDVKISAVVLQAYDSLLGGAEVAA